MFKGSCGQNVNIFFFCAEKEEAHKFMPRSYFLHLMVPKTEVLSAAELGWNLAYPSGRLITW